MDNVERRGETYYVRVIIPPDVRQAFDGKTAVWKSLRTKDANAARERAAPIISDIKRRIEAIRSGAPLNQPPPEPPTVNPDAAWAAIERWQRRTIDAGYLAHFNGSAPTPAPFGDEAVQIANRRYALQQDRYDDVEGFDDALVAALASEGISIHTGHPAIPKLRQWFAKSWREIESHLEKFSRGNFSEWAIEPAPATASAPGSPRLDKPPVSKTLLLSGLLDRFMASHRLTPKDTSEIRGYVGRLIQELAGC